MNVDFTQILLQLPALGIFVYYVLQNNKDWRAYLSDRNGKLEKLMQGLQSSLERNNRILIKYLDDEDTNEMLKE